MPRQYAVYTKGARGGPRASSRRAVGAAELQNGSVEAAEADVYYCWINGKAMAEGRKRVRSSRGTPSSFWELISSSLVTGKMMTLSLLVHSVALVNTLMTGKIHETSLS